MAKSGGKRRGAGRPKSAEPRNEMVVVHLSEKELELLDARREERPRGRVLRELLLNWLGLTMLVVAFFGGCDSGTFARRLGQDEAERIVWTELYSMPGPAPPIEWISHPLIGGKMGYTILGSRCQVVDEMPGQAFGPDAVATMPISATAFAHELMHYKTWVETGDVDPFHWRGDWNLADNVATSELSRAGL